MKAFLILFYKILIGFVFNAFYSFQFVKTETEYQYEKSFEKINGLLNLNITEILSICEECDYDNCLTTSGFYLENFKFAEPELNYNNNNNNINNLNENNNINNSIKRNRLIIKYNNIIASLYYYIGEIEFYGLATQNPNLQEGFRKFLIAAFYGNPASLYKMYILLETNIINSIINSNDYEKMIDDDPLLQLIKNSTFYKNFVFPDDYARKNIAFNFLFSSALSKYSPSMATIGYKYLKGNLNNKHEKYYKFINNSIYHLSFSLSLFRLRSSSFMRCFTQFL